MKKLANPRSILLSPYRPISRLTTSRPPIPLAFRNSLRVHPA